MLAEASAEYLSNCVKGGAQVVQLFDSWAGYNLYYYFKWDTIDRLLEHNNSQSD